MGQQQILFVILAVCIIAIAVSVGLISVTGSAVSDNRLGVESDLHAIAQRAQAYARENVESASFLLLNHTPDALRLLGFSSSNAHGDFFVKRGVSSRTIQFVGVGIEAGYDQKRPIRMMVTVWRDSTALTVLN